MSERPHTLEPERRTAPVRHDQDLLAPRLRRLAATAIDFAILPPVALAILLVSGLMETIHAYVGFQPYLRISALVVVSYLVVNGFWLIKSGQTLGKRLLKLKIVTAKTGAQAPLWRLMVRAFTLPVLIFVPVLIMLCALDPFFIFGRSRRCLHDFIAGTLVYTTAPASPAPKRSRLIDF